MQIEMFPIDVRYSDEFKDSLKRLRKKYPKIRDDLEPVIDQIKRGETPGARIKGLHVVVFKERVRNSDAQRGKSSGYRLIYYVADHELVLLVTIYSKFDQPDIADNVITSVIKESARILQADESNAD